jgi:lipooligosaccharide transport system permease protein
MSAAEVVSAASPVEKSVHGSVWQGSLKLVDVARARNFAWLHVAEARIRNMMKWWGSIAAFGLGNPVLYLFSVGIGIGALVDSNGSSSQLGGVPYLTFLAPALLASASIQAFQDETSFPVMEGFLWNKSFFAMNATPITGRDIINGIMTAAMVRTVVTVGIYEGVLLAFGAIDVGVALPMYFSAILTGAAFGSVMMAVTTFVKDDDGFFAIVGRFIIAPMMMFSGTFYPLESMPIYLQWVGWISPLWHGTDLGRTISYGSAQQGWVTISHWVYLSIWIAVGLNLGYRQMAKRLAA